MKLKEITMKEAMEMKPHEWGDYMRSMMGLPKITRKDRYGKNKDRVSPSSLEADSGKTGTEHDSGGK